VAWALLGQNVMVTTSTFAHHAGHPHSLLHAPARSEQRREERSETRSISGLHSIWSHAFSPVDRCTVLRFAASFLWADLEVADAERRFLLELAHELDIDDAVGEVARLLARPPVPEDIDPAEVTPGLADLVRQAALRAIAADGRVHDYEMKLFELLDDLLPKRLPRQ
jgi:hypothetical protein